MLLYCVDPTQDKGIDVCKEVLVRPENVKLSTVLPYCENKFPVEVIEENFLGSSIQYKVKMPNGIEIEADVHPDDVLPRDHKDVYASFDKSKAIVINC